MNKQQLDEAITAEAEKHAEPYNDDQYFSYKAGTKSPSMIEFIVRRAVEMARLETKKMLIDGDIISTIYIFAKTTDDILAAVKKEIE